MIKYQDFADGESTVADELYIRGTETSEILAKNSVEAFILLIDESRRMLNVAIGDGNIVDMIRTKYEGQALVDNAWQRLGDNWDLVMKRLGVPKG